MKRKNAFVAAILLMAGLVGLQAQPRSTSEMDSIARSVLSWGGARALSSCRLVSSSALWLGGEESFGVYESSSAGGFVIVSADKRMPEVLGYTDSGSFQSDSLPDGLRWFLQKVHEAAGIQDEAGQSVWSAPASRTPAAIAPLLGNRTWDQGTPYNNYCPTESGNRCWTGCCATALAQIMAHHRHPLRPEGTASYTVAGQSLATTINLNGAAEYRWDEMLDFYSGSYTSSQADAVATLMYHVGAAMSMYYSTSGSSSTGFDGEIALLRNFGYDDDVRVHLREYFSDSAWQSMMYAELEAGRPIFYEGFDSGYTSGHAFVLDGLDTRGLYHVNWGWNGLCNGYYNIDVLVPTQLGTGAGSGNYSYGCRALIHIRPDDGVQEDDPTNMVAASFRLGCDFGDYSRTITLSIAMTNLLNQRPQDFLGKVQLMLTDEEDVPIALLGEPGEVTSALPLHNYYYNWTVSGKLPEELPDGRYRLHVGVQQQGRTGWGIVQGPLADCSGYGFYDLFVRGDSISIGIGKFPGEGDWKLSTEIGVTDEREFVPRTDTLDIWKRVDFFNQSDYIFKGKVQILLADEDGTLIGPLGEGDRIYRLERGVSAHATAWDFGALLPDSVSDGRYRLYLGALPDGKDHHFLVGQTDTTQLPYVPLVVRGSHYRLGGGEPQMAFSTVLTDTTHVLQVGGIYRTSLKMTNVSPQTGEFDYIVTMRNRRSGESYHIGVSAPMTLQTGENGTSVVEFPLPADTPIGFYDVEYYLSSDSSALYGDGRFVSHLLVVDGDPNLSPLLQCDELKFSKMNLTGRSCLIEAEACNLQDVRHAAFDGEICIVLTDTAGTFVAPLDYTAMEENVDEELSEEIYTTLSGRVPETLPNGTYLLQVAGLHAGSGEWIFLTCTDESATLSCELVVKDSHMTVGRGREPGRSYAVRLLESPSAAAPGDTYKARLQVVNTGTTSYFNYAAYLWYEDTASGWTSVLISEEKIKVALSSGDTTVVDFETTLPVSPDSIPSGQVYVAFQYVGDSWWPSILHDGVGHYAYSPLEVSAPMEHVEESLLGPTPSASVMRVRQCGDRLELYSSVPLTGWEIISSLGTTLAHGHQAVAPDQALSIDLAPCPPSICFLCAHGTDGRTHVVKFVKRR